MRTSTQAGRILALYSLGGNKSDLQGKSKGAGESLIRIVSSYSETRHKREDEVLPEALYYKDTVLATLLQVGYKLDS